MLITIGLFFGIQTQFAHFQFGCYIKNRKNRNSCFGLFSFSRVASLLFGPGKGMAESFILLSSYQRNFTVFALLTRLLLQMDAILDQNVMAFITPELPRIRKKKILICKLFSYIFFIFPKGQHSYTQDSFRHGTVCGGRLAPFALSSSCL